MKAIDHDVVKQGLAMVVVMCCSIGCLSQDLKIFDAQTLQSIDNVALYSKVKKAGLRNSFR